jgi:DNA-binding response OmpR family regulator
MPRILLVHWHDGESQLLAGTLTAAGYVVQRHWSGADRLAFPDGLPEAVVVSLERLPSHGREVARWFREAKARQRIPLLFMGGPPEKVAIFRGQFPGALFCESAELLASLGEALAPSLPD